jgi:hypothetical protein
MNDSKTPKIVVGVVIAAVYAGGLGYFLLRDQPASNVAANEAAAPAAGMTDTSVPAPALDATSADLSTGAAEEGAALALSPDVPEPAAANEAADLALPAVVAERASVPAQAAAPERKVLAEERTQSRAAAERHEASAPVEEAEAEQSDPPAGVASTESEPSSPSADAAVSAPPAMASGGSDNDSQITAEVKTQIAAVAPASTIEVTTTDGVVELSGSVPSREEIDKVSLAARAVPNVISVDASALMVSN